MSTSAFHLKLLAHASHPPTTSGISDFFLFDLEILAYFKLDLTIHSTDRSDGPSKEASLGEVISLLCVVGRSEFFFPNSFPSSLSPSSPSNSCRDSQKSRLSHTFLYHANSILTNSKTSTTATHIFDISPPSRRLFSPFILSR
jgi:hypothetical protein